MAFMPPITSGGGSKRIRSGRHSLHRNVRASEPIDRPTKSHTGERSGGGGLGLGAPSGDGCLFAWAAMILTVLGRLSPFWTRWEHWLEYPRHPWRQRELDGTVAQRGSVLSNDLARSR